MGLTMTSAEVITVSVPDAPGVMRLLRKLSRKKVRQFKGNIPPGAAYRRPV